MCLPKILSIICSIPPHRQQNLEPKPSFHYHHLLLLLQVLDSSSCSNSQEKSQPFGHLGFHIDLNLELTSSSPETETNSVGIDSKEANSNQEKCAKEENFFEERRNPASETAVEDEKIKKPPFCSIEFGQEEVSLPLLTEAGEVNSENGELQRGELVTELGTQEVNGNESLQEERECWVVNLYGRFDEVSQVVRTKRGRRRILPCRYKDSVLQPLARSVSVSSIRPHDC